MIDTGNARYEKMKTWFTRNDRPRNKDNNIIKSPADYKTYIHSHLDEKCEQIDTIIADKESLISDLESYKKSLIFEVVTGKRKVC